MDLETRLQKLDLNGVRREPMALLTWVERCLEGCELQGDSAAERMLEMANLRVVREMLRERLLWVNANHWPQAGAASGPFGLPGARTALDLARSCSTCDWQGRLPDHEAALCPACSAKLKARATLVFGGVKVTYRGENLGFAFADNRDLYVVLDDADVADALRFIIRRYPIF